MKKGKKNIDLQKIINLYTNGKTPVEIAEILGCCISNITRRLKKAGFEFKRDYSKTRYNRTNRYYVDDGYFDEINTPDKAYFLGLMCSDGSISNDKFYIKLTDEDILQKFKMYLQYEGFIKFKENHKLNPNWKNCYILTVSSKKLVSALCSFGCTPNKTRTLQLPQLSKHLYRHFIRGFFDGDGCLQLQDKIYHCRFDLTSASKTFLEQVRPIIAEHGKTFGSLNKETNHDVWHLSFSGHQVIKILNWLYEDTDLYLIRKYNKYLLLSSF